MSDEQPGLSVRHDAELTCPFCGDCGPDKDWLIVHLESQCPDADWGHRHRARYVLASWQQVTHITSKKRMFQMGAITVKDSDQSFTGSINLQDAKGASTTPDNPPVWAEDSNGTVVSLSASADGLTATFTPVAPGTANVTVSVQDNGTDADGNPLPPIVGTGTATVTPGEAVQVDINFSAGGDQPAPAPAGQ